MFDNLSKKFQNLFLGFSKNKTFSEENVSEAVREVRMALLEADVNYTVASQFVKRVKEKVLGQAVIKSVKPQQQFIKIVHDELIQLMGNEESLLNLKEKPSVILLCGLQGSGKTTQCMKLAHFLSKKNKKVLVAACDLQRPAAIDQLIRLGGDSNLPVYYDKNEKNPTKVAKKAYHHAIDEKYDILIVDTAGRLHVDENLMDELEKIKQTVNPHEILFVANATTGQDAVKTANEFNEKIGISGSILTMLDGDARAGAAISIREITKKPLKFEGIGEKISDFQVFHPKSMADRILGMGDIINLVRKTEEVMKDDESQEMERKLKKARFNYQDYLKQMSMVKKMGSMKSLLKMIPGFSSMPNIDISDSQFNQIEAIILSMTLNEREEKVEISYSRRKRIAKGSGTSIDDVNRLIKGFKKIKQLLKNMPKSGLKKAMPDFKNMSGGNNLWH